MSIIEIRPNNGGRDAENFAATLTDSIRKFLLRNGYHVEKDIFSELSRAFTLDTDAPMSKVRWLEGAHIVQRIPKGSSARHTSSATVVVRNHIDAPLIKIDEDDLHIDRYRGHGKGGQNRNKVSTAIRVVHIPTGLTAVRESGRSQSDNLESAMAQIEDMLAERASVENNDLLTESRAVLESGTKAFTHNFQRGEVVRHSNGARWTTKNWSSGRFSD